MLSQETDGEDGAVGVANVDDLGGGVVVEGVGAGAEFLGGADQFAGTGEGG